MHIWQASMRDNYAILGELQVHVQNEEITCWTMLQ